MLRLRIALSFVAVPFFLPSTAVFAPAPCVAAIGPVKDSCESALGYAGLPPSVFGGVWFNVGR